MFHLGEGETDVGEWGDVAAAGEVPEVRLLLHVRLCGHRRREGVLFLSGRREESSVCKERKMSGVVCSSI